MGNTLLQYDILGYIKTVDQLEDFSLEIDTVLSGLFKARNKNIDEVLDKTVGKSTADTLRTIIEKNKIDSFDYSSLDKLLNNLKEDLKKIKVLKISLAIDPSKEQIEHIFNWVKENLGEGIILDIDKDESILGGAVISFNGQYKDFSLKRALEKIFKNKKAEIMSFAK